MYQAYITKIKNIQPIENADRLVKGECFGNTVVVSKDYNEETLYIYFPVDGQLSEEYCRQNDLVRRKDEAGNPCGGFLEAEKRNIKALRLRGERSDGLVMPLESLAWTGVKISDFKLGDVIDVVNGHEICRKYIPSTNPTRQGLQRRIKLARGRNLLLRYLLSTLIHHSWRIICMCSNPVTILR